MTPTVITHIAAGTLGLGFGALALLVPKGERVHRLSGVVFAIAMLIMGGTAAYLAVTVPGQQGNLFGGVFTAYLVATAWATVRRPQGQIGVFEVAMCLIPLAMVAGVLFVLIHGVKGVTLPSHGPLFIAFYSVSALIALAAAGDVHAIVRGGLSGPARLARHIWRMCTALIFATGSAFTNGLPRLLPDPMHVTAIYFAPMLVPLALMIFWLLRIRLAKKWNAPTVAAT